MQKGGQKVWLLPRNWVWQTPAAQNQLTLLEYRITEDVHPDRAGERWLNLVARKTDMC